ncbi:MAG: hypothetical protein HY951_00150 [Bacteroidia bacterium]|nr:hypothetical protein [Bacteroidia bacterium]
MIKYLILLLNFIGFLLVNLFLGDVVVSVNAPNEVSPGDSFTVELTITKTDLASFARYQQDLPIGYTATALNSFNGDFTFKDQKVKIIWLKLPTDSVFTLTYKIKVDSTAEGPLVLGGDFSYIYDNERKTMAISSKTIIVKSQGALANNNQNNNTNNSNQVLNNTLTQNFPANEIYCYRQIVRDIDGITVNLLINTANLSKDKFAKIQEKIPTGFSATNIESKDGIFSFKDNTVKFLWMSLPADNQFQVSYRLISGTPTSDMPDITGTLSYIENEGTKIKSIENKEFLGTGLMANNTNQQNNQNNQTNNQTNVNNVDTNNQNQNNLTNNQTNNNLNNQTKNNNQNQNNLNNNQIVNNQTVVSPENGVNYKVQIGAYRKNLNVSYFKRMQVNEQVSIEINNGLNKYIIGSHSEYKEARDHRVKIWETTPIRDAFVSAYNNGSRITVQEAIMIANQKWYQ